MRPATLPPIFTTIFLLQIEVDIQSFAAAAVSVRDMLRRCESVECRGLLNRSFAGPAHRRADVDAVL